MLHPVIYFTAVSEVYWRVTGFTGILKCTLTVDRNTLTLWNLSIFLPLTSAIFFQVATGVRNIGKKMVDLRTIDIVVFTVLICFHTCILSTLGIHSLQFKWKSLDFNHMTADDSWVNNFFTVVPRSAEFFVFNTMLLEQMTCFWGLFE